MYAWDFEEAKEFLEECILSAEWWVSSHSELIKQMTSFTPSKFRTDMLEIEKRGLDRNLAHLAKLREQHLQRYGRRSTLSS